MASATKVGLTEKQRYWLRHLRQCEEGGQSLAVYAKECGLDLKNLYRWKSVLAQRGLLGSSLPGFTPVRVEMAAMTGACRVRLTNGVVVELTQSLAEAPLAALLMTLGRLP